MMRMSSELLLSLGRTDARPGVSFGTTSGDFSSRWFNCRSLDGLLSGPRQARKSVVGSSSSERCRSLLESPAVQRELLDEDAIGSCDGAGDHGNSVDHSLKFQAQVSIRT